MQKRNEHYNKIALKVENDGVKQGAKEQKSLIERLEYLRDLKLGIETKVFLSEKEKEANKLVKKDIMHLINKSKDPVGELTKIIELLKGNATARVELPEKEKAVKYNRLKEYMTSS